MRLILDARVMTREMIEPMRRPGDDVEACGEARRASNCRTKGRTSRRRGGGERRRRRGRQCR